MKVINEGSQSKERAGVSVCSVIRRILKELPARKERHIDDACPSYTRAYMSGGHALCFTTTLNLITRVARVLAVTQVSHEIKSTFNHKILYIINNVSRLTIIKSYLVFISIL